MTISERDKHKVITILNNTLGYGYITNKGDSKHTCPFCHHAKPKLEVNPITQKFHCWVCDAKGRSIYKLLSLLDVDKTYLTQVSEIYKDFKYESYEHAEECHELKLPKEYKPLWITPKKLNFKYNKAINYLVDRDIPMNIIRRYKIGYCESGIFSDRIIVPSYDSNDNLNYFIARSYFEDEPYKYKNPPVNKNVIAFENEIDWTQPITLCEGVFDALQIRRNVIPLLGKFLSKKLKRAIFDNGVKEVNIILDADAKNQALNHVDWLQRNDIRVKFISLEDLDAADLGFKTNIKLIKTTKHIEFDTMVLEKLKLI